jgi:hypothetical protein
MFVSTRGSSTPFGSLTRAQFAGLIIGTDVLLFVAAASVLRALPRCSG